MNRHEFFLLLVVASFFSATVGCGDPLMKGVLKANETNLAKVANCYALFKTKHDMKAPRSKDELVDFIATHPGIDRNLERMGVERDQFESYFTSERDGEKLIIHWGADGIYAPPYAFEASQNHAGKYWIAGGGLKEVGEHEYQDYLNKKVKAKTAADFSAKPVE